MLFFFAALVAYTRFSALVSCTPGRSRSSYAVKDSHRVPKEWTRVGQAPGEHMISLEIGLKQSRFDELERHLLEGKYWASTI